MRDIKFRALKDGVSECNFVYGQLVYDAIGNPRITHKDFSGQGLTFNSCQKGTVGQFTGFLDSKGKEIYEGDILSDQYEDPKEGLIISRETVFFDVKLGTWMLDQSANQDGSYASSLAANLEDYEYTVVGNIHEKSSKL